MSYLYEIKFLLSDRMYTKSIRPKEKMLPLKA